MGCTDSTPSQLPQEATKKRETAKDVQFMPEVDDGEEEEDEYPDARGYKTMTGKGASKSVRKSQSKDKEKAERKSLSKQQKENKLKVKKAKQLASKPSADKFITQIVEVNRQLLTAQIPTLPTSNSSFIKPVIEYSPTRRGGLLPADSEKKYVSHWNTPITETGDPYQKLYSMGDSYMSVNEAASSPYKQRLIEERLRDIRKGREHASGKASRIYQYSLMERNASYY